MGIIEDTIESKIKNHRQDTNLGNFKFYESKQELKKHFFHDPEEVKYKKIIHDYDSLESCDVILINDIARNFVEEETKKIITQIISDSTKQIEVKNGDVATALEKADDLLEYRADTLVHPAGFHNKLVTWNLIDWKRYRIPSPVSDYFLLYPKGKMQIGTTKIKFKLPDDEEIILKEWFCTSLTESVIIKL